MKWAGHVARMMDELIIRLFIKWKPNSTRFLWRSPERWENGTVRALAMRSGMLIVKDRERWKHVGASLSSALKIKEK